MACDGGDRHSDHLRDNIRGGREARSRKRSHTHTHTRDAEESRRGSFSPPFDSFLSRAFPFCSRARNRSREFSRDLFFSPRHAAIFRHSTEIVSLSFGTARAPSAPRIYREKKTNELLRCISDTREGRRVLRSRVNEETPRFFTRDFSIYRIPSYSPPAVIRRPRRQSRCYM